MLGCVGTEERSLVATKTIRSRLNLDHSKFLRIRDPLPEDQQAVETLWAIRVADAEIDSKVMVDANLLDPANKVVELVRSVDWTDSLIIDISVLPKRVFFLLVKEAIRRSDIRNLLAVYTTPEGYPQEPLASNPQPWKALPGFDVDYEDVSTNRAIVLGVGYLPIGLSDLVNGPAKVTVLFPFPPASSNYNRNWRYFQQLSESFAEATDPIRVSGLDAAETFEALETLGDGGDTRTLLVPYGPKPMSLGMCLYACAVQKKGLNSTSVYYAQPQTYSIRYSQGVQTLGGVPNVLAYPIKLEGKCLYEL